MNLGVGIAITN